jgi:hypothetical protein
MKRQLMLLSGLVLLTVIALAVACGSDDDDGSGDATRSPAEETSVAATVEAGGEAPTVGDSQTVPSGPTLSDEERATDQATRVQGDRTEEAIDDATAQAERTADRATEQGQGDQRLTREAEQADDEPTPGDPGE